MHYCTPSLPVLVIVSSRDRQRVTLAARVIRSQNCPPLLSRTAHLFTFVSVCSEICRYQHSSLGDQRVQCSRRWIQHSTASPAQFSSRAIDRLH